MSFIFDKLANPLNKRFKIRFESFLKPTSIQKTVSEVQKTWYFPYSEFGRQANGREGLYPFLLWLRYYLKLQANVGGSARQKDTKTAFVISAKTLTKLSRTKNSRPSAFRIL